ncbi:hypothetical protein [Actinomadura rupiterrae]|uniref:hypothetical protein n=1 Tax=Actinomadura rupiterrae TaxID=559627 RepID=UPI0020A5C24A|nr:hypothetical protein [Actinomadura rupiterrae]MCP2336439.1 hypothetical protein [Actinomadura rupiterrae]
MKLVGLGSYEQRLAVSGRTLLECQGFDGGWGLTLSSVSSIVHTSEVLAVLRAAGIGGSPVRAALGFLSGAVEEHCRPRQKGGRGENTRFVCFGLTGLLYFPEFFTQPQVCGTAAWCVDWLEEHRIEQGWPEVVGIDDTSLRQTALAVLAMARLRDVVDGLGPDLVLPDGTNTSALVERAAALVEHGLAGLLYHRRSSGAWGWRTYVETAPSPSKTALCLLAVDAARWADRTLEVGGVDGSPVLLPADKVVAEAGNWLLRHHSRWETFVEDDKDVQGTAWEHMAYALGVQAALRAGANPGDQRLIRAWKLMDELWDGEAGLWSEPGASGRRATIRAAYYSVCAYEEARTRVAQLGMTGRAEASASLEVPPTPLREVSLFSDGTQLVVSTTEAAVTCTLTRRLFDLAVLLHHHPAGLTVRRLAALMHVAPSSIPKYVQRINAAISREFNGAPVRLIVTCQTPEGSGYQLALPAEGRGSAGRPG